ncbi:hypothetical protein JZ751_016329 [Albula glossodonta]|uniref:glutathione transferase n=1 Tax=Albula glossodonta TaxID=121402 RepID=A0A8T2MIU0_9TELE|nr:hypothetical protein JZ751_016329 [Albula glossodonta]
MTMKLAYWDIRGLAQPIRLLLEYTGTKYEDKFYSCGEAPNYDKSCWFDEKHTLGMDFPNLPYLEDGDRKIVQSNAIMRYIARKHNMCGESEDEKIRVDILENQAMDFRNGFVMLCYTDFDKMKPGYMEKLPGMLKKFSSFLGDRKWFAVRRAGIAACLRRAGIAACLRRAGIVVCLRRAGIVACLDCGVLALWRAGIVACLRRAGIVACLDCGVLAVCWDLRRAWIVACAACLRRAWIVACLRRAWIVACLWRAGIVACLRRACGVIVVCLRRACGVLAITFVDFIMYELLDQHRMFDPKCLDDFKNLRDFLDHFEGLEKIAAYMKSKNFMKTPVNNKMAKWGNKKE